MKLIGTSIDLDLEGTLLLLHGMLEGAVSLANLISPTSPWDQVQPQIAAKFCFGGVLGGAVLAITTLLGPRPVPRAAHLTLAALHLSSAVLCIPGGPGYPSEGIDHDWDSLVSGPGMALHGAFGVAFAYLSARGTAKPKGS
jgi:hypothetical protein